MNGAPAGKPPSFSAPRSSVSVGLEGSVMSTSWKSPIGAGKKKDVNGSENGDASNAKTPSGRSVSDSS